MLSLPVLLCQKGWDLRRSDFKIRPRLMVGILHYGISPFGLSISISVMMLITNLRALRYGGTEGVAIYAVLSYVLGSIQPLITGVGDGIQPLLSNARGAGNEVAVTRLGTRVWRWQWVRRSCAAGAAGLAGIFCL